ncbi:MAG TPA: DNA polymerase I, partial [Gemmataceae bacterium]|nr:DNA polymerase I [Gemmataceae bacterium]
MSAKAANERLFLVDAYSLIFQVFHALPPMSGPGGLPTNALYGFTKDLLYLRNELKPDYLLVCWDVAGPTFRDQLYKEYKAHRAPMPDDLQLQVPLIQQMLEAMRVPQLGVPGFEADDLMATVARAAAARGIDVYLCTSDKDCRQLLDDHVRIYNLRKRQEFTRESLLEDWGVTPEQVVDLQTLVGDSVDNVPGVKGVGVKTAAKLLQEHGSLDNLMAHLDKVKGKLKENLQAAEPILPRSRQLVRLDTAVPLEMDWDGWRRKEWDAPRLLELFQKWGFRTFAEQVRSQGPGDASPKRERGKDQESEGGNQEAGGGTQGELFSEGELFPFGANAPGSDDNRPLSAVGGDGWKADYQLVDTPKKLDSFLKKLSKQRRFAVDLETTGLERMTSDIVGLAFSWKEGEAYYLALRGPAGAAVLDPEEALRRLRPVLEDAGVAKVNQNIKFDLLVLRRHGVQVRGVAGDPMVADYLLRPGERGHNLEELARRRLHHQVIPITELIGKKGKNKPQLRMDEVATSRVAAYAGEDADVAWRLCGLLEGELAAAGLTKLYESVEVPLIEVLAELEYNGIRLDVPLLREMSRQMAGQLAATEEEIYELAGRPFNIASLPQLRQVLFDELKLPVQRKTGITGAASTDQETLEKLAAVHPLPRKILEHRQIAKLKSTYVDALPELVNPHTGRVHASFNQTVAATGRLSASDPNLQNIPIRTELGGQIRQAFVPEEGWGLLTADYSQIELRMLAHFSGDEELRRAFAEDRDVHTAVAAQIFGVPEAEVTREQRRVAKTVNFGVIYGMSAHGLAQRLEIPREEAAKFIDAYFARYPKVLDYQANLLKNCLAVGYVSTILGRRRHFDPSGIRANSTYQQRNQPEREAINMEIQGSAADLMKLAMLGVYRRMRDEKLQAKMLLSVHDELV